MSDGKAQRDIEAHERAIEILERDIAHQGDKIASLKSMRRDHWLAIYRLRYGVDLGVVVKTTNERRAGLYLVTWISTDWDRAKPWVKGRKKLKSGEWGEAVHQLFNDWEVVEQ